VLPGKDLVFGQSITDPCIDWDHSVPLLRQLAEAARKRRAVK
jgi:3-deoxy-7-phosphoheptulonate synthase